MVTILLILPVLLVAMLFGLDVLESLLFPPRADPSPPEGPDLPT